MRRQTSKNEKKGRESEKRKKQREREWLLADVFLTDYNTERYIRLHFFKTNKQTNKWTLYYLGFSSHSLWEGQWQVASNSSIEEIPRLWTSKVPHGSFCDGFKAHLQGYGWRDEIYAFLSTALNCQMMIYCPSLSSKYHRTAHAIKGQWHFLAW